MFYLDAMGFLVENLARSRYKEILEFHPLQKLINIQWGPIRLDWRHVMLKSWYHAVIIFTLGFNGDAATNVTVELLT